MAQENKMTLFIALGDVEKKHYDVIVSDLVDAGTVQKFRNLLRTGAAADVKHFWTIVGRAKPVDKRTVAPFIRCYLDTVGIVWSMAKRGVAEDAAQAIADGFGFAIQPYEYIEPKSKPRMAAIDITEAMRRFLNPPEGESSLDTVQHMVDEFLKPRPKRRRTEEESSSPSETKKE